MFGQNAITKPLAPDANFRVHSIFYTIQGEGPWAGRPTIFVRFTGCNLRCFWCDTEFETGKDYTPGELLHELRGYADKYGCTSFVLTGGEPFIQPLGRLFAQAPRSWMWQAETAGTVWPAGIDDAVADGALMLVCSPKTGKLHEKIVKHCGFYKYIVDPSCLMADDGLPMQSTQKRGVALTIARPPLYCLPSRRTVVYVQPRDDQEPQANARNLQAAVEIAMKYGYRLSVQVHKIAGLP